MRFALATSVIALGVLAAAAPQHTDSEQNIGRAIPITKRSPSVNPDHGVDIDALSSHVASVEAKIQRGFKNFEQNTGTPHPSALNRNQKREAPVRLTNDSYFLWYGTISVGTPFESFTVDFDTGSADLFLPSTECDQTCRDHKLWDPNSSTTSQELCQTFNLTYGDGSSVTGDQYADTVSIGGYDATNQTLGAAKTYSHNFQRPYDPADGLMGMSFDSISVYNACTVFSTLVNEGQVKKPVFSFKLSSSGSELYIGGSNRAHYTGDITYTSVTHQAFWQVEMDDLRVDGQPLLNNVPAIIDTGTTLIIGIPAQVLALYSILGGTPSPADGPDFYTFPCSSFPSVSLTFGGRTFPILASALILGPSTSDPSRCVSAIIGRDLGAPIWVIGDTFLQSVYSVFDLGNSRVGFAELA